MAIPMTELRTLARLFREGVGGAEEQLMELASPDTINNLGLRGPVDVRRLVRAIEDYSARQRHDRIAERRELARAIAQKLGESARFNPKKNRIDIDPGLLAELAQTGGYPLLAIDTGGHPGVLPPLPLLRELFRRCQGVRIQEVFILGTTMTVLYRSDRSLGTYRLQVQPLVRAHEDVLVIQVPEVVRVPTPTFPKPADQPLPVPTMVELEAKPPAKKARRRSQEIHQARKRPETTLPTPLPPPAGFRGFLDRVTAFLAGGA
jgi:hypothetical protein